MSTSVEAVLQHSIFRNPTMEAPPLSTRVRTISLRQPSYKARLAWSRFKREGMLNDSAIVKIQAMIRGEQQWARFVIFRGVVIFLQRLWRAKLYQRRIEGVRRATVLLQCTAKWAMACSRTKRRIRKAGEIQRWARGCITRGRYPKERKAIIHVQKVLKLYRKLRLMAIRIQRWWRYKQAMESLNMSPVVLDFDELDFEKCATIIQAFLRMAAKRRSFLRYRASVIIQRNTRRYSAIRAAEKRKYDIIKMQLAMIRLMKRREARMLVASCIQRFWRGYVRRKMYSAAKSNIVILQSLARRHLVVREHYARLFALAVLQRASRRYLDRKRRFHRAIRLQSLARKYMAIQKATAIRKRRLLAVLSIQRFCLCFLDRKLLKRQRHSAIRIQAASRRSISRNQHKTALLAISTIQRSVRGFLARQRVALMRRDRSAILIQSAGRRRIDHVRFTAALLAIITIQRHVRGLVTRQKVERTRKCHLKSALVIQRLSRGLLARLSFKGRIRRIILLQSNCRAFITRSNYKRHLNQIVLAQKYARRFLACRRVTSSQARLSAVLTMQRYGRGLIGRNRYGRMYQRMIMDHSFVQWHRSMEKAQERLEKNGFSGSPTCVIDEASISTLKAQNADEKDARTEEMASIRRALFRKSVDDGTANGNGYIDTLLDESLSSTLGTRSTKTDSSNFWRLIGAGILGFFLYLTYRIMNFARSPAFCAPLGEGMTLTTAGIRNAPWWASQSMEPSLYEVICRNRTRFRVELRPRARDGMFDFFVADDSYILGKEKQVQSVHVADDTLFLRKKGGKFKSMKAPWVR